MYKAICIKGFGGVFQGDVVKARMSFTGNMQYYKKFWQKNTISQAEFDEHFVPFNPYYVVEKPMKKGWLFKAKPQYLRVEFKRINEATLAKLYVCAFSYIELVKRKNPSLIQTFNYSIVTTLEKLEYLYKVLPPSEFLVAISDSEQVFKGIYKTAISLELETLPKANDYEKILEDFKTDNNILGDFFKQLYKN